MQVAIREALSTAKEWEKQPNAPILDGWSFFKRVGTLTDSKGTECRLLASTNKYGRVIVEQEINEDEAELVYTGYPKTIEELEQVISTLLP